MIMTIKPCKECGAPVSDKADACPMCGAKVKKMGIFLKIILWFFGIMIFFAVIGKIAGPSKPEKVASSQETTQDASVTSEPTKKENWINHVSKDEMRGTETRATRTISTNEADFEFPYNGGSNLVLTVRKGNGGTDLILNITKGQFICSSFDGCKVNFKFDSGKIQTVTMVGSDTHDTDILFVESEKTTKMLIQKLKASKKLIIEPSFFQEGTKQFTFDVEGFQEP